MDQTFKLKDFFNKELVSDLANALKSGWPEFEKTGFEQVVNSKLYDLELKERSKLVSVCLKSFLPTDYPQALSILLKTLNYTRSSDEMEAMSGFYYMPHCDFVADYGLDHFEESMHAMYEITKRFTSEFSIRFFLRKFPVETLARLKKWTKDENHHVRRLVSEGMRPRLPWSFRLKEFEKDPSPVIELLELLKDDDELYVRRSVANNLNDITKNHPDRVVELLTLWNTNASGDRKWIIRHALRSLVKEGHSGALLLLGYSPEVKIILENFHCDKEAFIGGEISFHFELKSLEAEPANLMIDFVVHYRKASGKQSPKVFKLAQKKIEPNQNLSFNKKLVLKQRTTRKLYAGKHHIEIQVNGKSLGKELFQLNS